MLAAGAIALDLRGGAAEVKGTATDVVTEADRRAEAALLDVLRAERPGDSVTGEEGGTVPGGTRRWLLDPVDGTLNYATGLPDVIATYRLDGGRYRLVQANPWRMNVREALNWLHRGQELVDTMAAPYAADVVGLLKDNTSYGVAGDHGGAQRPVQEIPIVFGGDGVGSRDSRRVMRSVDILPTILHQMGIPAQPLGRR